MADSTVASITHRRVLKIAVPIVLSNATVPILGVVDTGVVGQLGEAAPIGAVGIGAVILTAVYWFFGFLRMGTAGMTSQARGQNDRGEVVALLARSMLIAFVAGFGLIMLHIPLIQLAFLVAPASPAVESLAMEYIQIRVFAAPAAIALYGITGWLVALERTRAILIVQLFMNGLNIALDVVFVLWLDYGVEGVAVATLIAEWSGLILGVWLCRDAFANGHWRNWPWIFDRGRLKRMARVNTDIMIRSVLLEAAFVSFLFLAADFGDVTLAANQVLLQFVHVTAFSLDGFAFAAEALVGLSVGSRTRAALRKAVKLSCIWAMVTVLVVAGGFALFGATVIDVLTTSPEVRSESRLFLPWVIAAPIIGWPSWMLDGIFIGAMRTRDMRNAMFVSILFYGAAVWILIPIFGNHGLWMSMMVFYVARAVTLGSRYPALENTASA